MGIEGKRVLIPRAAQAREILPQQLTQAGAEVCVVSVYETLPDKEAKPEDLIHHLKTGDIDMITFTSSSTVMNFFTSLGDRIELKDLKKVAMACIGPITEKKLAERGFTSQVVPEKFTIPALVDAIADYYTR
jgi:uroporphyrinogen III methyltransferase/synthase